MTDPIPASSPVRIALIGAGEIGLRHLQALQDLDFEAEVWIVDVSEEKSRAALAQCVFQKNVRTQAIRPEEMSGEFEVTIIATTAATRLDALRKVLGRCTVKHCILEKVLFQKLSHYEEAAALLQDHGTKGWVNCPRRQYPCYRSIKKAIGPEHSGIEMTVIGSRLRLGTNLIHFVDLLSFLSGDSGAFSYAEALGAIQKSKRPGCVEFDGHVSFTSEKGSLGLVQSHESGTFSRQILIRCGKQQWQLDEGEKWMRSSDSPDAMPLLVPLQSQLTGRAVRDLTLSGICDLPSFEESSRLHRPMLKMFLRHIESTANGTDEKDLCPIS